MSQIKQLLGDSIIYGIGSFFLKATQIFILPLILFYLNKSEFGTLDYFLNIKNILIIVYGWGILTSIFRFSELGKNNKDISPFNGFLVALTIILTSTIIILFALLIFDGLKEYKEELAYVQLISTFGALMTIPLGVLRQKRKPVKYIIVNSVYTISFLLLSYFFVIKTNLNYKSILLAHVLAAIFSFSYGAYIIRKDIDYKVNIVLFKKMFNFGFSILLNSFSFVVILGAARFFLKANGTFEDIGILGMALRLSLFVGAFLVSPFTLAWLPFVKTQMNRKDFNQTMNSTFRVFSWIGLLFCLALELILRDVFHIIGSSEYIESLPYVLPFSIAYFIQGIYFIFAAGIFISSNNRQYRILGIVGITVNLLLYTLLRNYITIELVVFITVFSFLTIMILAYFFGNKVLNIRVLSVSNIIIYLSYIFLLLLTRKVIVNLDFSYVILFLKMFVVFLLFGLHFLLEKQYLLKKHIFE